MCPDMSRFFDRNARKRELEEAVRRRLQAEPPQARRTEPTAEAKVELIRTLMVELTRREIEIRELVARADGFSVRGSLAGEAIDRWYSISDVEGMRDSSHR